MNVFALSLIKNEVDIIEYTLNQASEWATKIFVLDNGSEDGTWELVKELSKTNKKVIPWKCVCEPFYEGMRHQLFNNFFHEAEEDDWWCFRLDADETYIEDPREFLRKIPKHYDYVCKKSIDYMLTHEDIQQYKYDNKNFVKNVQNIKYFLPAAWVETRFFRYKANMVWKEYEEVPQLNGLIYPKTILAKHYQFRSPIQIQKRLDTRIKSKNDGTIPKDGKQRWAHIKETSWRELIKDRNELIFDKGMNSYKEIKEINPIHYAWYKFIIKYLLLKLRILK